MLELARVAVAAVMVFGGVGADSDELDALVPEAFSRSC